MIDFGFYESYLLKIKFTGHRKFIELFNFLIPVNQRLSQTPLIKYVQSSYKNLIIHPLCKGQKNLENHVVRPQKIFSLFVLCLNYINY